MSVATHVCLCLSVYILGFCSLTEATTQTINFHLDTILHRPIHSYPYTNPNLLLLQENSSYLNVFKQTNINALHIDHPLFTISTHSKTPPPKKSLFNVNHLFLSSYFNEDPSIKIQPNISDKHSVLNLARMTANAYTLPTNNDWIPVDRYYANETFGWTDGGLRGYIYTSDNKNIVIVTIKGTSAAFLGIGGDTAVNDKINDNRMFSCCCAHVDRTWSPYCGCYSDLSECDWKCLKNETSYEESYYSAGQDLYKAVSLLYPKSQIWFTGHSLGGSVASLLAATYGTPAITFEAPGEKLFAQRLGLATMTAAKTPLPIYHFGHDADPIYTGRCRGPRSSCYYAGYAIETKCHLGTACTYRVLEDEVTGFNQSWHLDIRHHRIYDVIKYIIEPIPDVPQCVSEMDCSDCLGWSFV